MHEVILTNIVASQSSHVDTPSARSFVMKVHTTSKSNGYKPGTSVSTSMRQRVECKQLDEKLSK